MSNVVKGFIDKLGTIFFVASMVPSLAFVIAFIALLDNSYLSKLLDIDSWPQLIGTSVILLTPTIIISFTLTALNTFILKFFEGYVFFHRVPFMQREQEKKAGKLMQKRERLARRIKRVENRKTSKREQSLSILKSQYYNVAAEYDDTFPPSIDNVLPTSFGNILRASEAYSATRYGIDGVHFWPRLIQVIDPQYQESIDQSRNELSFLVNCSVLSGIFSAVCIGFFLCQFFLINTPNRQYTDSVYLILGVVSISLTFIFYRAALLTVGAFGVMIRSAYDLFRHNLLEQFHLGLPENSYDEFFIWKNLGEFVVLGPASLDFTILEYQHEQNSK